LDWEQTRPHSDATSPTGLASVQRPFLGELEREPDEMSIRVHVEIVDAEFGELSTSNFVLLDRLSNVSIIRLCTPMSLVECLVCVCSCVTCY
jgi:hypothetical protein